MCRRGKKGEGAPEGMKACYKAAKESGDREEEARWANQIGHAYKDRGDYVDALTWFRLDYDISIKRNTEGGGPRMNLMPTCQSLGEIYHRLGDYKEALHYQQRHLDLAVAATDLVEQQRAHTQLGRTHMEMYEVLEDVGALLKAKDAFNKAMNLAKILKANPPPGSSNFVVELVDAYNNLGTLRMITDEPLEARKHLQQGLRICDQEEVGQNDATRTRLHHNLGRLFSERRQWGPAMIHVMKDIEICRAIPHPQGEVKGLINLADIHFKQRQYKDAIRCYSIAHEIVRELQDEDILMKTVQTNKEVVEAAVPKLETFHNGLAKHKEMLKKVDSARGLASERSLCLQEFKFLKELIAQAYELQYWEEHLKLAKRLKKIVVALGDLEKMGDALDVIGESYFNLCNYEKAKKWHHKSFKVCERVQHKEGQTVALINYGNALDSAGDYQGALKAYEEAFEIVKQCEDTHLLTQKIAALDNIHYCYVVRFNRIEDASSVQDELKRLKQLKDDCPNDGGDSDSRCMETDDEAEIDSGTQKTDNDDELLAARSPLLDSTNITQINSTQLRRPEGLSNMLNKSQTPELRKRSRLVLSDESEDSEESAGYTSRSPRKKRLSRLSAKNTSVAKISHPPEGGQKSKRRAAVNAETLNLSSDDDEPLENIWRETLSKSSARRKNHASKNSQLQTSLTVPHKINPSSSSSEAKKDVLQSSSVHSENAVAKRKTQNTTIESNMLEEDGRWTLRRLLTVGNPSHGKSAEFDDDSQPGHVHRSSHEDRIHHSPRQRVMGKLIDSGHVGERLGVQNSGAAPKSPTNRITALISRERLTAQTNPSNKPHYCGASQNQAGGHKVCIPATLRHGVMGDPTFEGPCELSEHGHALGDSHDEVRITTSSCHDGAGSHNSDSPARSSLMQPPLIVPVNINGQTLRVIMRRSSEAEPNSTVGWLLEEILRLYTCDSSAGKKPVVQRLEFKGSTLKPVQIVEEVLNDMTPGDKVDAIIQGWVAVPLVDRYESHCVAANCSVNTTLTSKLKHLKGSYEEVDASSCNLEDVSVRPLIAALQENDALSALDLSHNHLGNGTMSAIQEMIAATNQSNLGLTLDLHNNQLGAGALLQICKCHVTISRLEVLKLSGNRLTDAAARSLAAIVAESKALATLEIEGCGVTTRTIQQIGSSLLPDSSLVKLCIGRNNPVGGSALALLFQKLSTLVSFTELDIRGIELDEKAVLAATFLMESSSSLSVLNMAGCEIQNHGAQAMCSAMTKTSVQLLYLDLSACGFSREPAVQICQKLTSLRTLVTLNLSNNVLNGQAAETLSSALCQEGCRIKSLSLNSCSIGPSGVLHLLRSLQGNAVLWELHVAGNFELGISTATDKMSFPEDLPQKDAVVGHDMGEQIQEPLTRTFKQDFAGSVPYPRVEDMETHEDVKATGSIVEHPKFESVMQTDAQDNIEQFNLETKLHDGTHDIHDQIDLSFRQALEGQQVDNDGDTAADDPEIQEDFFVELSQVGTNHFEVSKVVVDNTRVEEEINRDVRPGHLDAHVIEELVIRIRMAHGLQCLNLSDNGLGSEVLRQFSEAWGYGGRSSKEGFLHKAHFLVQSGRECSALMTTCASCQLQHG